MTFMHPQNLNYRVDPSTPFLFMDPLSTLRRIPRTSKLHLTSWLNISKVNRSMAPRQMTLTISMAWEMPFGILYLQSTRLNGTVYSQIKKLTLLEPKFRRNLLWELPSPMVTLRRISPSRTLLLSIRLRLLPLFQQSPRRRSTVRRGSHRDGSPQNRLGDERTCGTTLASAYVLRRLSAVWSQLQMKKRKSKWKWVLNGVSPLNTGDWVQ